MSGLVALFEELEDPRAANATHRLTDLMVIMLAAFLCGQTKATEIAWFAELRKETLNRIVAYDRAPSHDTFSRVLRLIDARAFAKIFARFARAFSEAVANEGGAEVVACDGKALRRAYEKGNVQAPPMMVSAFGAETGLVLAAMAPKPGKGEIDALCEVIELLDLTGKIVTADALHATHKTAETIEEAGADYAIGLKRNRPAWHDDAVALFDAAEPRIAVTEGKAHGRDERREAAVVPAPTPRTAGHVAYGRVISQRGDATPLTRYFLLSKRFTPDELIRITRSHWRVENNLHWVLDVHLDEDHNRARKDNAPANIALLTRLARNILQSIDTTKTPIIHRIKKCTWCNDYLISALTHMR